MRIELPAPVAGVLSRLRNAGAEAYAVGGSVRDMLLGTAPHDWDVCTSAAPDQVARCFADCRLIETGLKHGTITVGLGGQFIEVTTYRVDGAYSDHRRPDAVRFTPNLTEDLARRDCTINAMAYAPGEGVIDPFDGQKDLQQGVIRCVGAPALRFEEDALRILRALRFAARLGFTIDSDTAEAMIAQRELLRHIAAERVLSELSGMDFARVNARFLPVLQVPIPELMRLPDRPVQPLPVLRLAALLKGLPAREILSRLKASAALTERAAALAERMDTPVPPEDAAIRRLLRDIGPEAAEQLLLLQEDLPAQAALRCVIDRGDCYALPMLAVTGRDLIARGLRGRAVGEGLTHLLNQVIEGELPNEREALLAALP
jgi:tRNA nucleotidyltransferase (CCA-adding enzyme)